MNQTREDLGMDEKTANTIIGTLVVWTGRKQGSCSHDSKFTVGEKYPVCYVYESNGDFELQGNEPEITIRAGSSEYSMKSD